MNEKITSCSRSKDKLFLRVSPSKNHLIWGDFTFNEIKELAGLFFQVCGKEFNRMYNLLGHMHLHSDSKPFRCPYCSSKFTLKGNLSRHMKVKHGVMDIVLDGQGTVQMLVLMAYYKLRLRRTLFHLLLFKISHKILMHFVKHVVGTVVIINVLLHKSLFCTSDSALD